MSIPYTYWQEPDGYWLGYWNDYPDQMTQGRTLVELRRMLRSLRADIMEMIADGRDPFFDEPNASHLRRAIADMDAKRNIVCHDIIEDAAPSHA